jgi:general transcription factor IIIA
MALKRKAAGKGPIVSIKKRRRGNGPYPICIRLPTNFFSIGVEEQDEVINDVLDDGFVSDDSGTSDDAIVEFTDNGTKRAESEARRQWNYICDFEGCRQRFNRPCRLESHMRSHTKERPFSCPHHGCTKDFPRKDHLQRHLKNAHLDTELERGFVCDWEGCGKSFTSSGRLQRHKDVHESKLYCTGYPPCNEHFRKEKTLEAHIKAHHLEVKPFPCTYVDNETGERCKKGYETEGALRKHIVKIHADGKDENDRYLCMTCIPPGTAYDTIQTETGALMNIPKEPLSFSTKEELLAHSRDQHPPICSLCGVTFGMAHNLKTHLETTHANPEDQPQYPCPKPGCEKVFNRQHNLNVHIRCVHEQKAQYFCTSECLKKSKHPDLSNWDGKNACGAAFKAKSSLDQHIRTHHLALPNRKAMRKKAKANKTAPEPSMLTLLTGIGYEKGRNVQCLVHDCQYRFYMDRDLRRHLRATHKWSEELIEEKILEREALAGGQFWIGGMHEPMFDSPQTPAPYSVDHAMQHIGEDYKLIDPQLQLGPLDRPFDWDMFGQEEVEMDAAMGLDGFPAVDVHDGDSMMLEFLSPVKQYNL